MISYFDLLKMIEDDNAPYALDVYLHNDTHVRYQAEFDLDGSLSCYCIANEDEINSEYKFYLSECFIECSMFDGVIDVVDDFKLNKIDRDLFDRGNITSQCYMLLDKQDEIIEMLKKVVDKIDE